MVPFIGVLQGFLICIEGRTVALSVGVVDSLATDILCGLDWGAVAGAVVEMFGARRIFFATPRDDALPASAARRLFDPPSAQAASSVSTPAVASARNTAQIWLSDVTVDSDLSSDPEEVLGTPFDPPGAKAIEEYTLDELRALFSAQVAAGPLHDDMVKLLLDYKDVFATSVADIRAPANFEPFKIETVGEPVLLAAPYRARFSPAELEAIGKQVREWLAAGIVVKSTSPVINNLVCALKKDGSARVCIDPRPLNKATVPDSTLPPVLEETLHAMHGAKVFSHLDWFSGYLQIPVEDSSQYLLAFTTPVMSPVALVCPHSG